MNPGRELDALVGEKVFGITFCVCSNWDCNNTYNGYYLKCNQCKGMIPYPAPYSTDIRAAWEIVGKLKPYFPEIRFDNPNWTCGLKGNNSAGKFVEIITQHGDTAPHAICLAALRATGNYPEFPDSSNMR